MNAADLPLNPLTDQPDLCLRRATPEDAEAIAALKVLCWRDSYKGLMPDAILNGLNAKTEAPHWREWLSDSNARLIALILEEKGKLLGYGLAGPMRKTENPDKTTRIGEDIDADAEIFALYMHPGQQRRGLGSILLKALITQLIAQEYRSLGLWMLGGNEKAESFYKKYRAQDAGKRVEIHNGRIVFREKGWIWPDLKALKARMTLKPVGSEKTK